VLNNWTDSKIYALSSQLTTEEKTKQILQPAGLQSFCCLCLFSVYKKAQQPVSNSATPTTAAVT